MLAIDVGGTFIKYAIVNGEDVLTSGKLPTRDGDGIVEDIIKLHNELSVEHKIEGIGISTAGFIDPERGIIAYSNNIPNYQGKNIIKLVGEACNCPVVIDNDVTSCLYNFEDADNLVYLAVGTGIGGGYVNNSSIFRGANFAEMEIGHIIVRDNLSFEELCSTRALLNRYEAISGNLITGEELNKLYLAHDEQVIKLLEEYFTDFASALVSIYYILDPKEFVIGGGVSEAEMFDMDLLMAKFNELALHMGERKTKISKSPLGNDAAFLGIAKKFYQYHS